VLIGYHAVYDESYADALEFAASKGFDCVQFDLNVPHFSLHRLSAGERSRIRDLAARLGLRLSFHAPGDDVSLFTDHPGIRDAVLRHFAEIVGIAEEVGARHGRRPAGNQDPPRRQLPQGRPGLRGGGGESSGLTPERGFEVVCCHEG
jgi:sugar phosphate isomerase/epimerase